MGLIPWIEVLVRIMLVAVASHAAMLQLPTLLPSTAVSTSVLIISATIPTARSKRIVDSINLIHFCHQEDIS